MTGKSSTRSSFVYFPLKRKTKEKLDKLMPYKPKKVTYTEFVEQLLEEHSKSREPKGRLPDEPKALGEDK